MANSRSTTLAWYTAGSVVAAGSAGTDWWPGGAITADTALTTLSISAGSPILTRSTGSFLSTDVGRFITVNGAGAGGVNLETYILSYQSATQVTLAANASTALVSTGSGVIRGEWWQNKRLCGDIPQSNLWSKTPLYTNIYLKNVHATNTYSLITVGVTRASGNQNSSITIGKSVAAGVGVNEATRANTALGTAPASVVFGNSISIASLAPTQFQSIWLKHTPLYSNLAATSTTEAGVSLTISATY